MAKPLTDIGIKALPAGKHHDGGGLYLQVTNGSGGLRHSWLFRYYVGGKERQLGLGPYPRVSLKVARKLAAEAREKRKRGIDPLADRKAIASAEKLRVEQGKTFDQIADDYIAKQKPGWRNAKHADQWTNTLRSYASPKFGSVAIGDVTTGMVVEALTPIWSTKPETAKRVRGRVEAVLDYAKVLGLRTGENPAAWRGNLSHVFPPKEKVRPVEHHAALPWADLPKFMAALRLQRGIAARALEFVILTAARSGEVRGARWSEIEGEVWNVPAERMKAGRAHRVPLSAPALAVLDAVKPYRDRLETDGLIFPGQKRGRPLSDMSLTAVLRRMKVEVTAHGFRSTFSDWAAETTEFPRDVVEMALAHAIGNRVEAAYRRGDLFEKRKALMTEWAVFAGRRPTLTDAEAPSI